MELICSGVYGCNGSNGEPSNRYKTCDYATITLFYIISRSPLQSLQPLHRYKNFHRKK